MTDLGALEAGGTKFICAIGNEDGNISARRSFPTRGPGETLAEAVDFFRGRAIRALGIGAFGPLDLQPGSPTRGSITSTPKTGWQSINLIEYFQGALNVPIGLDTDVNAAALAEQRRGAGRGLRSLIYLTVGTGIGGGVLIDGHPVHGISHPEIGHLRIPRDPMHDPFEGICLFHGDCLEGLASGPAIARRWGQAAESLSADHPAWVLEAHYLALAVVNLVLTLAPQRILLGGGVMHQGQLFPLIRLKVQEFLNGYLQIKALGPDIREFIQAPGLGDSAGVLGALELAADVFRSGQHSAH